jgi:hypothetical protein
MTRPLTTAVQLAHRYEAADKQLDVARIARSLIVGLCKRSGAHAASKQLGDSERFQALLKDWSAETAFQKAAVAGSTLREGAAELGSWRSSMREFLRSLGDVGAADGVFRWATPSPWIGDQIVTGALVVGAVSEAQAIPVRRITATAPTAMVEHKLASIVVGSETYFAELGEAGLAALNAELRKGCILGTDNAVFGQLTRTPTASSGDPVADLVVLLNAVAREAGDRLVLVAGPDALDEIQALPPAETPAALTQLPLYCTSATNVAADSLLCVNASSLRFADLGIEIDASNEAALQMADNASIAADSPPVAANLVSLWQTNAAAARVQRSFKIGAMRSNAIAEISGIAWNSGSP